MDSKNIIPEEKTYKDGFNDGWNLAKSLICNSAEGGMSGAAFFKIFRGYESVHDVMIHLSADEVMKRIEEYNASNEICVGDEIIEILANGLKLHVLVCDISDVNYNGLTKDGAWRSVNKSKAIKTGNHLDISSILGEIGRE